MIKGTISKKKVVSLLEYLVAICVVLNLNSVYLNKNLNLQKLNFTVLMCTLSLLIVLHVNNILKNKKKFFSLSIIILTIDCCNLIFISLNKGDFKKYIYDFIFIFILFLIYFILNTSIGILKKISRIIIILSIISLIFYFFGSLFHIIKPTSQIVLDWGGEHYINNYYNIHFDAQPISINGIKLIRNTGIFTEGPMYSFNLCIALIIQLLTYGLNKNRNIIIITIAIVTTISTSGIIILMIVLASYLLFNNKHKRTLVRILNTLIIPVVLVILVSTSLFFINDKMNSSINNSTGSFSIRVDDFNIALQSWKNNMLVGNGYGRHDITQQYMGSYRGKDIGGSNALIIIAPQGGIYLLVFYLIPMIFSIIYSIKFRRLNLFVINIVLLILYLTTNVPYSYISLILLALGWAFIFDKKSLIAMIERKKERIL